MEKRLVSIQDCYNSVCGHKKRCGIYIFTVYVEYLPIVQNGASENVQKKMY